MTTLADGNAAVPVSAPAPPALSVVAPRRSGLAVVKAYVALTKPRIIELLLVTTVPTMILADRGMPSGWLVLATLVGGTLAAGSANALNCYVDRDIDAVMRRTERRPLATHSVEPRSALVFGLVLGVVSLAVLGVTTNWLATVLAAIAIAGYVLGYTMGLKRRTSSNIVWGGAAGCMPVPIGWAAVTGSLDWPALVLFLVIFFWTPPHFWALAMRFRNDYAAAGVPMLPVVASPQVVADRIVVYSWAMVLTSFALVPVTGWVYLVLAAALGGYFLREAHALRSRVRDGVKAVAPMKLFHASITYLALVFGAVALDQLLPFS